MPYIIAITSIISVIIAFLLLQKEINRIDKK